MPKLSNELTDYDPCYKCGGHIIGNLGLPYTEDCQLCGRALCENCHIIINVTSEMSRNIIAVICDNCNIILKDFYKNG